MYRGPVHRGTERERALGEVFVMCGYGSACDHKTKEKKQHADTEDSRLFEYFVCVCVCVGGGGGGGVVMQHVKMRGGTQYTVQYSFLRSNLWRAVAMQLVKMRGGTQYTVQYSFLRPNLWRAVLSRYAACEDEGWNTVHSTIFICNVTCADEVKLVEGSTYAACEVVSAPDPNHPSTDRFHGVSRTGY